MKHSQIVILGCEEAGETFLGKEFHSTSPTEEANQIGINIKMYNCYLRKNCGLQVNFWWDGIFYCGQLKHHFYYLLLHNVFLLLLKIKFL